MIVDDVAQQQRITIARVGRPKGLKGWLWCDDFGGAYQQLKTRSSCMLCMNGVWRDTQIIGVNQNSPHRFLLQLQGVNDRNQAQLFVGAVLGLFRSEFSSIAEHSSNEFYACDLLGARVLSPTGCEIGLVSDVVDGVNCSLLEVRSQDFHTLIPFIKEVVQEVSLEQGIVSICWEKDEL